MNDKEGQLSLAANDTEGSTLERAVTDRMRRLVLAGAFAPGHHLQEIPLAGQLGVSRTPVRAALAALAQEGLLISRPKRGYLIRQVSLKEVLDAYRVRGVLEGLACRILAEQALAGEGIGAGTLAGLQACVDIGERIVASGQVPDEDHPAWRENNERFHRLIADATGNAALIDVTSRTLSLPMVSSRVMQYADHDEIRIAQYQHRIIVEAIGLGQGARAEAMMIEHVHVATQRLRRSFDGR